MTGRIGIVGIGWWATVNHIPVILEEGAVLAGICDQDEERLHIVGEKFGVKARYTDLDKMLQDCALDGLVVSTPHIAHTQPAISGLEAGCHVLIEKPMATSFADAHAIRDAALKSGKEVMVPTGLNFTDWAIAAHDAVKAGAIGEMRHVVCQMGSALDDLFAGQPMLETKDHIFRPPVSTWADPKRAGGYGWGQLSHALSLLVYITDCSFEKVYAQTGKSPTGVDYYDAATATTRSGATAVVSGASTVPKHRGLQTDIRIFGTKGMMSIDIERPRVDIHALDGTDTEINITSQTADYDGKLPMRRFVDLCKGTSIVNASSVEVGTRVTAFLDAMYRSSASGNPELVEV